MVSLAFADSASAQFVTGASNSTSGDSFQSFYISYAPTNMNYQYSVIPLTRSTKTVSVGWAKDVALQNVENLYYEIGVAAQYMWCKEVDDGDTELTSMLGVKVPLSLAYMLPLSANLSIMPYAGLDPTLFILGTQKSTYDDYYDDEKITEKTDLFKKDEDGDAFSRFVLNWHVGGKVFLNDKYFAGVTYEGPITNLYKDEDSKCNYNMTIISVGLLF